ncbi:MAG: hypothetical protein IJ955_03685 [Oscillospiraceae bacterium]|nr:hypothetical protein [Oscillospiraceae bacterium]
MKTRDKIILSVIIGLFVMSLEALPMWWGVLFSPITQQLTQVPLTPELTEGLCWEVNGMVLRFRSLDLLMAFLHR